MRIPSLAPGWDDDDFRMGRRNRRNVAAQTDAALALADLVKPRYAQNGELKVRPWPIRHRTSLAKAGRSGKGLQDYIDRCREDPLSDFERERLIKDGHLEDMEEVAALYGNLGVSRESKGLFWDAAYQHELGVRPSGQTTVCNHLLVNIPHWLDNPDSMRNIVHGIADVLDSYVHPADRERGLKLGWSAAVHHPPVRKAFAEALAGKLTEDRDYKLLGDPRHLHAHIIYHDRPARLGDDGCWQFGRMKIRIGGAAALMELRERVATIINEEIERDGRSQWRVSGKNYRNLGIDVTPLKYESDKVYRARGQNLTAIRATSYSAGANDGTLSAAAMEQRRERFAKIKRRERAEALARGETRRQARHERARDREYRQYVEDKLPATQRQIEIVRTFAQIFDVSDLVDETVFISRSATTGLITMLQATKRDMTRFQDRKDALRLDLRDRLIAGQRVIAALRHELEQADYQIRYEKEARQAAVGNADNLSRDLAETLQHVNHLVDQLKRADQQVLQARQAGQRVSNQNHLFDMKNELASKGAEQRPLTKRNQSEAVFVVEKSPGLGTRQIFLGEPKPGDRPIGTTRVNALDQKLAEIAAERGIQNWKAVDYSDKTVSETRQSERRQQVEHARAREQHAQAQAAAETAYQSAQKAAEAQRVWQALIEAQRLDQTEIEAQVRRRVDDEIARRALVSREPAATAQQLNRLFAMLAERDRYLKSNDTPVTAAFADELITHLQQVSVKQPNLQTPPPQQQPEQPSKTMPLKRPRGSDFNSP